MDKFTGADDSRVGLRHTATAAAVASFRTWRGSRPAVAQGPTIISACKKDDHQIVSSRPLHNILAMVCQKGGDLWSYNKKGC